MSKNRPSRLLRIYAENPEMSKIRMVVDAMKQGAIVIYPTDTIYAMGCDIHRPGAIERIVKYKSFNGQVPQFSLICEDISQISEYTKVIGNDIFKVLKRNLPGPFTFILESGKKVPKTLNQKRKTIGMRVPDNGINAALIKELGNPMITTSIRQNDDILEYLTSPELIFDAYKNVVDYIIDGGPGGNVPSTIVDCSKGAPEIVREGLGMLNL